MLREVVDFRIIPEETVICIFERGEYKINGFQTPQDETKFFDMLDYRTKRYEYGYKPPKTKLEKTGHVIVVLKPKGPKVSGKRGHIHVDQDISFFDWINDEYERNSYRCESMFVVIAANFSQSKLTPYCLGNDEIISTKRYWLYLDKVYWENDNLDVESVKALVDARDSKKQRKIEFLKGPERKEKSRQFIEDDVKIAVWKRDGGKCVKCGSNKDLEFDHIIPVSMGGSSTERNLQLLCERCNREKGADLK
jgi:hypothetical protein